jgi:hypothetical protein
MHGSTLRLSCLHGRMATATHRVLIKRSNRLLVASSMMMLALVYPLTSVSTTSSSAFEAYSTCSSICFSTVGVSASRVDMVMCLVNRGLGDETLGEVQD